MVLRLIDGRQHKIVIKKEANEMKYDKFRTSRVKG